jgi:hypothetical protein
VHGFDAERVDQLAELTDIQVEVVANRWPVRQAATEMVIAQYAETFGGERLCERLPLVARRDEAVYQDDPRAAITGDVLGGESLGQRRHLGSRRTARPTKRGHAGSICRRRTDQAA